MNEHSAQPERDRNKHYNVVGACVSIVTGVAFGAVRLHYRLRMMLNDKITRLFDLKTANSEHANALEEELQKRLQGNKIAEREVYIENGVPTIERFLKNGRDISKKEYDRIPIDHEVRNVKKRGKVIVEQFTAFDNKVTSAEEYLEAVFKKKSNNSANMKRLGEELLDLKPGITGIFDRTKKVLKFLGEETRQPILFQTVISAAIGVGGTYAFFNNLKTHNRLDELENKMAEKQTSR